MSFVIKYVYLHLINDNSFFISLTAVLLLQLVFSLPAPQQDSGGVDLEERYGFRNFPPNNRFIPNRIPNNFPSRPWPQRGAPQRGSNNNHLNSNNNYPNDDIFIFDRPLAHGSTTRKAPARPKTTTTTQAPLGGTTRANCNCPTTAEFNPVCGTDETTYGNPGKLRCANICGKCKV